MQTINIMGNTIAYRISGKGPVLLLLHDGFFSSRSWDPVRDHLTEHFRVIEYDRVNYGNSQKLDHDFGNMVEYGARELKSFIEAIDLQDISICGHCMGGAIAAEYISQHPERIKKFAAEAVGFFSDSRVQSRADWTFKPWDLLQPPFRKELENMHGPSTRKLWDMMRADEISYIMDQTYNLAPVLKKITIPVLFIYGDRDFYFNIEHAAFGFNNTKKPQLWIIPQGRHDVHRQFPELFSEGIIRFLTDSET